jgi:putative two-component system response regulator
MPLSEARDIIAAGRGSHFDPDMADAFLHSFDAFADIAIRHLDSPKLP